MNAQAILEKIGQDAGDAALRIADDAKAKTILAALPVARGNAPVPPESKQTAQKTDAEILSEFEAMPQCKAKDEFQRAHGSALLRAFRAKSSRRT